MNREAGIEETLYRLAVELIQKDTPRAGAARQCCAQSKTTT